MRDLIDIVTSGQLDEAVGQSVLYHGTDPQSAEAILHYGKIEGRTEHSSKILLPNSKGEGMRGYEIGGFRPSDGQGFYNRVRGVSLTRDPRFARKWKSGEGVVLVLDRTKIAHRHRLVKVAFFSYQKSTVGKDEAEEFLVGDLLNVEDYLVSIQMTRKTYDELSEIDANYDDLHKPYLTLLNHRLLEVDDRPWHPETGMRLKA